MNDQQHLTDESFDELARSAGAALRRPAPSDGVQSVRTARRRQQQTRAALGGAALVAIVAVGAAIVLRDDPETIVVEQPDQTTPATVAPTVPSSTVPNTAVTTLPPVTVPVTAPPVTAPPVTAPVEPVAGPSAEAAAWRDARIAEGFTTVDIVPTDGTTARMLTAQRPDPFAIANAVLLDDGRVIELPAEVDDTFGGSLYGVGGAPALLEVVYDGNLATKAQVWILDPRSGEWVATGDLGFTPTNSGWGGVTARSVGDALLVADNSYALNADGSLSLSPDQRGVVIRGDLSITEMAPAPDGVALFFTSTSGGKALQLYAPAVEGGNSLDVSYDQPWQYDPTANEWTEIPIPDWMDCTTEAATTFGCDWAVVPDIGSLTLEVETDRGVVARVPDGTVGLYDARASEWRRMDDSPFVLWMPTTALVGDQVVVAPWRSGVNDFTQIGVLDVASGTWTTNQVEIPSEIEARIGTEWADVSWDLRTAGSRVLAVPGPSFQPSTADPIAVYDVATGSWSTPNEVDLANWDALAIKFSA